MITNTAERDRIEAVFAKNAKKVMTLKSPAYTYSDQHGELESKAISGSTSFFIKRAVNGSWAGWYSNGVLQHEEGVSA